jgi:hypothetical protein
VVDFFAQRGIPDSPASSRRKIMKLLKATLPRLWRLTRTTSMVVGLAVMVGLVAGVASLAVAQKSPSGGTTSSPLLKGVENVAAATTTLINTGTGPAMSMRVPPGNIK